MILVKVPTWRFLERFILVRKALVDCCRHSSYMKPKKCNKFIHINMLEFIWSEPTASVKTGLVNCSAHAGEEATLTVELSAICSGTWTINDQMIRSGSEYLITRSKTTHTLVIREVSMALNGAQVRFVGGGSQSVATLSVKGKKAAASEKLYGNNFDCS